MQYILICSIVILVLLPVTAWGHGIDIDTSEITEIGDKKIQITTEIIKMTEQGKIIITVSEVNSDKTMDDVTLFVKLQHDGNILLHEYFVAPEGILKFAVKPSNDPIKINGIFEESSRIWSSDGSGEIVLTGEKLDLTGLYTFEIDIEEALWINDASDNAETFRTDVSIAEDRTHITYDSTGSVAIFETRSYFDTVRNFEYDPIEKYISFQIPFNWDDEIIAHVPVVHVETRFPKNFTEFFSNGYTGTANNIDLFKSSIVIDDYTLENFRTVHFVMLGDHLRYLKNNMEKAGKIPTEIVFTLNVSSDLQFPLVAMTRDEQFQIDLSWSPLEISHEEKTKFIFTIRDGATGEPLRHSSYDFIIIQSDNQIYKTSGMATVGGYYEEYDFAEGQTGPTIIRFENIRGTGQQTEFGLVVIPELGAPLLVLSVAITASAILGRFKIIRF
ncbi:MAG: putative exported protein [Cenarchaeum symbiont of Oopsacas minuta]|nr:putative exported protein [Cenarchaeum symbiont of Oopsacas minuta]